MCQVITQRVIALLCLAAFGLGQCVFGSIGVKCENASGQTSYEFACLKTSDGSCLSACDSAPPPPAHPHADTSAPCDDGDGEHSPHPCKDTPIGDSTNASKILRRLTSVDPVQFLAVVPLIAERVIWLDLPSPQCAAPVAANSRPPDTVARLRTIIMTV